MAAPVIVKFQVEGVSLVQTAIRTVEQGFISAEQAQSRSTSKESKERVKSAQQEAKEKLRAYADLFKQLETAERNASRAADKEAKERTKNAKDEAKKQLSASKEKDAELESFAKKLTKTLDNEEKKRTSDSAREAKNRADEDERQSDKILAARKRMAHVLAGAAGSGLRRGLNTAIGLGTGLVNTALSLGGGFGVADAIQRSATFQGQMTDLSNSGLNLTSGDPRNRVRQDAGSLGAGARAAAIQFGYSEEEAGAGMIKFTKITGDLATARNLLKPLAELSRATASNLDDMADAAGNVSKALDERGFKGDKVKEVMKVMRGLGGQGIAGAIEISDMPKTIPRLVAAASGMSGDIGENILRMGAVAQLARGGGGAWNAQAAGTGVTSLAEAFTKGPRRAAFHHLLGAGFKFGDEQPGGRIDFDRVMASSITAAKTSKTGSFEENLNKLFGSTFAKRGAREFGEVFEKGAALEADPAKKAAAGEAAIRKHLADSIKNLLLDEEGVRQRATLRMQDTDMKMAAFSAKFRESVADKLLPEIMKLLPVFEKMMPQIVAVMAKVIPEFVKMIASIAEQADQYKDWIAFFASNAIPTIIIGSIGKSMASAAIGEWFKRMLTSMMGGGAAPVPGAVAGGGAVLTASAALAVVTGAGLYKGFKTREATDEAAEDLAAKVNQFKRTGGKQGLSPAEAQKLVDDSTKRLKEKGTGEILGDFFTAPAVEASARSTAADSLAQSIRDNVNLKKAIGEAITEGVKVGMANAPAIGQPTAAPRQMSSFTRESGAAK